MDRNSQLAVLGIIVVAVIGVFMFAVFFNGPATPKSVTIPTSQMVGAGDQMTGTTTAKVTMVEWGDFECPFCGQEAPLIKQIIAAYGKNPDFNFVFKNYPLPQHMNAKSAAEASLAAGAQGKYWDMYELLYQNQSAWVDQRDPTAMFITYAKALGLNQTRFASDISTHMYLGKVTADQSMAISLGLDHTPSIFINGVEQTDLSYTSLTSTIDAELKK